jgi:hypothetical protein
MRFRKIFFGYLAMRDVWSHGDGHGADWTQDMYGNGSGSGEDGTNGRHSAESDGTGDSEEGDAYGNGFGAPPVNGDIYELLY